MIVIKPHNGNLSEAYYSDCISFSFVSSPTDGRRQCMKLLTCRDFMHEVMRTYVHQNNSLNYTYSCVYDPPIDMKKLRILIASGINRERPYFKEERSDFKNKLFSAKKVINFYECVAKWTESTKISSAKIEESERDVYLLTGPKEWLSYPSLLSMFLLLVRMISKYGPIEFKNNHELEEEYKRLLMTYGGKSIESMNEHDYNSLHTTNTGRDIQYLKICHRKLYSIMLNYEKLFTDTIKKAYPRCGHKEGIDFHRYGGITATCAFRSQNRRLRVKLGRMFAKSEGELSHEQKRFYDRYGS